MPAKILMSWKPDTRRWKKMYRGKMYIVSCRQLGVAETKEASWKAANEWFAEQKRIADEPPEDGGIAMASRMKRVIDEFKSLDEESRREAVDSILGVGGYRSLLVQRDEGSGQSRMAKIERSVEANVESWRLLLLSNHEGGLISAGRYESYVANVAKFADWIGPTSPIDAINESKIEGFYKALTAKVSAGECSPVTAHGTMMTARQFVRWLAEQRLITLPSNIDSRRLRFHQGKASKIEVFAIEEIRAILAACEPDNQRTKLYVLLGLNCGQYQLDMAELRQDEVDWDAGIIRRARTKTRDHGGPVVSYKLWPETFDLLKKFRSSDERLALTSGSGRPLAQRWVEAGKTRRYDLIASGYERIAKRMGMTKHRLGMKHLRKTSATILGAHPNFKYYVPYFLAHAPKGVSDRHYVVPSDIEFFEALDWLRIQILDTEPS